MLANLGEVPVPGFRITAGAKFFDLRGHFITGVKIQRSFLRGCHGRFLMTDPVNTDHLRRQRPGPVKSCNHFTNTEEAAP